MEEKDLKLQKAMQDMELQRRQYEEMANKNQTDIKSHQEQRTRMEAEIKDQYKEKIQKLEQVNKNLERENKSKANNVEIDSDEGVPFDFVREEKSGDATLNVSAGKKVSAGNAGRSNRFAPQTPNPIDRKRKFEDQQKVIQAMEEADNMAETQKAMEQIDRK